MFFDGASSREGVGAGVVFVSPCQEIISLSYTTIPVFEGEKRRLYREDWLAYIISDETNPTNHPIFTLDTDLGSRLLQITYALEPPLEIRK